MTFKYLVCSQTLIKFELRVISCSKLYILMIIQFVVQNNMFKYVTKTVCVNKRDRIDAVLFITSLNKKLNQTRHCQFRLVALFSKHLLNVIQTETLQERNIIIKYLLICFNEIEVLTNQTETKVKLSEMY